MYKRNKMHRKPRYNTKKECYFTAKGISYIDYKDVRLLRRFTANNCQILPRKITGTSAKMQRQLNSAIKKARIMGLLPFLRR